MVSGDCGRTLRVVKFCRKMVASLPLFFSIEIPYSKLFWGRTFLIANRFSRSCGTFWDELSTRFCNENNLHKIKRNRRYPGKPLSEIKNYTLTLAICVDTFSLYVLLYIRCFKGTK